MAAARGAPMPPIQVLFVLPDGSLVLDWSGPAEALRIANRLLVAGGAAERFALRFVGPAPEPLTSVGVRLAGIEPLPDAPAGPAWVVLVGQPGPVLDVSAAGTRRVLDWLRGLRLAAGGLELLTVCAGAVLAGHAGLLDGRRATTHHHHLAELARVAGGCQVVHNRVFVDDAPVFSSAGVTTGIDLVLHRIAAACGAPLAARVAQTMVVALRRGPQDPELSPFLAYRNHIHPVLHKVQDAVSGAPQDDWSVARMAAAGHTSARHLTRLFVDQAGIAPLAYLRRIRLAVAQAALQSGHNVTRAAEIAGFSSDTQLRRAWHQFGQAGTPSGAASLQKH